MASTYEIGKLYRERKSDVEWETGFFKELEFVLVVESGAIPKNVWDQISSNEQTRKIWTTAFTHFSVDFQDNYEYFETFGDALLDSALKYLIYTNPTVWQALQKSTGIEGKITNISQKYTAKPWMRAAFQRKFRNLNKYIRCADMYQYQGDLMEDCLESMIFAIQNSMDTITWKGQFKGPGFPAVNKFVEWLYKDVVKNFATTQKVDSQFLKELVEIGKFNYSEITAKLSELSSDIRGRIEKDIENKFFKAYGPKKAPKTPAGAQMKFTNPFAGMESEDIQGIYKYMMVKHYDNNKYTVFYFDGEEYRANNPGAAIDKTIADNKIIETILEYMQGRYPNEVAEKRNVDVGGEVSAKKYQKEFRDYGFIYKDDNGKDNYEDYNYILNRWLPKTIDKNTVQFFSKMNIKGTNIILWGIETGTNRKVMLFGAEIPSDITKEERNAMIAKAASKAMNNYKFHFMISGFGSVPPEEAGEMEEEMAF
jgi:dsRNA-specific ribonuclease